MRILYIGYWPAGDGLTQSVIVPRLKLLSTFDEIEEILFCSIERTNQAPVEFRLPKVTQVFFTSQKKSILLLTKLHDFLGLNSRLSQLMDEKNISLIICNSTLAGIIGYQLYRKKKVPFVVECFEPHSMYMREVNVWKSWDPRYLILRHYEGKQKECAFRLVTVSKNYTMALVKEGIHFSKIVTVPNCVQLDDFKFNGSTRASKRAELNIDEGAIVGIYVGKFGDIYYDEEAFDLFEKAYSFFGEKFHLIILTPANQMVIHEKFVKRNISINRLQVILAPHQQVPDYMSVADFAFSTIRPSPGRLYCCPIKNGEYWANGLPVLLEDGIGEDSEIIRTEGGGIVLDFSDPRSAFEKLFTWMKKGRQNIAEEIFEIAVRHRRMSLLHVYYSDLLATNRQ